MCSGRVHQLNHDPVNPRHLTWLIRALEQVKNLTVSNVIESGTWHSMPIWTKDFPIQLSKARKRIEKTQEKLRDRAEKARQPH